MKKSIFIISLICLFFGNISYASGTVWEDLHTFTVKQCNALADIMTIEDFDEFASHIYTPAANKKENNYLNFNKETAEWLCAIKHHQSEQNYLTMIVAQELGLKPLSLPLLQLNQNTITTMQSTKFQRQQEKSLKAAHLDLLFHQAKQHLDTVISLLRKEAQLRKANVNINKIITIQKQTLMLLYVVSELQIQIDKGMDQYKHRLDVMKSN